MSKLYLLLILCVFYVQGQTDVSRYRECVAAGSNPETVVRVTPMKIWYSIAATTTYKGFPELHDKFYLKTAQRVKVSYKIVIWFSQASQFVTRLKIDDTVHSQFNEATTNTYERTHEHEDLVRL